jgi:hypothetical protein
MTWPNFAKDVAFSAALSKKAYFRFVDDKRKPDTLLSGVSAMICNRWHIGTNPE